MGDFFSKENYPKGTQTMINNDFSEDEYMNTRKYVKF